MKNAFEARQKFIANFSARVNDEITCIEMVELRANKDSLEKMGLSLQGGAEGIWGVIVVCKKSLYFYAPPKQLAIMSLVRVGGDEAKIEEQIFCFDNLPELNFIASEKKWFQIFSQNKISFSFLQDGRRVQGEFLIAKNSVEILLKIRAALGLN